MKRRRWFRCYWCSKNVRFFAPQIPSIWAAGSGIAILIVTEPLVRVLPICAKNLTPWRSIFQTRKRGKRESFSFQGPREFEDWIKHLVLWDYPFEKKYKREGSALRILHRSQRLSPPGKAFFIDPFDRVQASPCIIGREKGTAQGQSWANPGLLGRGVEGLTNLFLTVIFN
jgi:hypothetical protein